MIWFISFLFSAPPLFEWSNFIPGTSFCVINTRKHPSYIIMLTVAYCISPAILQPIFHFKIYKIFKLNRNNLGSDLNYSLKNKSKIHPMPVDQVNHFPVKEEDVCDMANKNPNFVEKYTVHHSGDSKEHHNVNENFEKVKVICSNTAELPNDAKRSGITRNRLQRIELYKILKHEAKTTAIMVAVVIAFYVCWTPLMISSILYVLKVEPKKFGLVTFAFVITCTNGVINPLIYGVMNKQFRKAYKRIFRCC